MTFDIKNRHSGFLAETHITDDRHTLVGGVVFGLKGSGP